jgi:hypothetical protein
MVLCGKTQRQVTAHFTSRARMQRVQLHKSRGRNPNRSLSGPRLAKLKNHQFEYALVVPPVYLTHLVAEVPSLDPSVAVTITHKDFLAVVENDNAV